MSNEQMSGSGVLPGKPHITTFWVLAAIETMLLAKFAASQMVPAPTELLVAIVSVAALLLVTGRELKTISVGKDGLKVELAQLHDAIRGAQETIAELAALSMGEKTFENLKKLESGHFGAYVKEPFMGLETELYYLRNHGFLERIEGSVRSIHDIPTHGENLSQYVEITEAGIRYIKLREEVLRRRVAV